MTTSLSVRHLRHAPLFLAISVALAVATPARAAQLADLPLEELMRIEVVSASRKTQRLADVAASMHVLTADDIRSSGVRNLPEALRLVPGMDVAQLSGSRWGVSTRGFTGRYANKLLVLVDGRSVYSPIYSGVIWELERVPLDTIDRIEVLHGPAGSIWGSNAVNGVINIITKSSRETQGGLVDVAVGDGGRRTLRARQGGETASGATWRIGAMADEGAAGRSAVGTDGNDAFQQKMVDARWDRTSDDGAHSSVDVQLLKSQSDELQSDGLYVPPYVQPLPIRLDFDRLVVGAHHEQRVSPGMTTSLRAAYTREAVRFGSRTDIKDSVLDADASAVWQILPGHELNFGAGLRYLDMPAHPTDWISFDPINRRGLEWSLYAQDEWTMEPGRWRMTLGARVDHDLYTGSHLQPNLRLLFTPTPDLALWGGLSRANRTLSRGEHDGILKVSVLPPGTAANPGPLPIQLFGGGGQDPTMVSSRYTDAAELGLRMQASSSVSVDATLFTHVLRDDIGASELMGMPVYVATPQPHLEVGIAALPYTVHLRGFEGAVEWRPAPGWRHQLAASYLEVRGPGDAVQTGLDEQLRATPRWLAQWRSVIDLAPKWRLDARLRYAGERGSPSDPTQHVDAYTALDATLSWHAAPSAELQIGGTNLLRPAVVEFRPDFLPASATLVQHRVFVRWVQAF